MNCWGRISEHLVNVWGLRAIFKPFGVRFGPFGGNLVIRNGTLIVEDYNSNSGLTPAWVEQELILLNALENSQDKNAFFYFYFPNKENLVINALFSGLDIID